MANQVYANNMEVSCKAANGKSVAAFPDVCFTPPQTPATPPGVPIPYPNTGLASDTTNGSRSVKISKKEVMLKNKSYFKKSYGDEAGCAPKKGIITSHNMGKVYFNAWSMNVRIEGENAVRMMDITTHNHGSFPGNSPTWPYLDKVDYSFGGICHELNHCMLVPKEPGCNSTDEIHITPHHLIPGRCTKNFPGFNYNKAPCICVIGENQHTGSHKECHRHFDKIERFHYETKQPFTYTKAVEAACTSASGAMTPIRELADNEKECIKKQLDNYYRQPLPDGPSLNDDSNLITSGARGKVNTDYDSYATSQQSAALNFEP